MAKFIQIPVSGNSDAFKDGNQLLSGDSCATVSVATTSVIHYHFLAGTTGDVAAITYTGGATEGVKLKDAINYALTANPGGILAKVKIPAGATVTGIVVS